MPKHLILFVTLIFVLFSGLFSAAFAKESERAENLYEQYKHAVYQIRVIDIHSGEKLSIGSAFRVEPDGYFVTNFHVVSAFLHDQNLYRLEYLHESGETGPVQVRNIDLIHDLALLSSDAPLKTPLFHFRETPLKNGERVFSMGNPHDLGMIIVEGTYNGLLENSFYKKMLFSGALNPGMSGGPAFDYEGNIIGVNVATQGNDISYLVPVSHIDDLLRSDISKSLSDKDNAKAALHEMLQAQLAKNEKIVMQQFMEGTWGTGQFGNITVPKDISPSLKCWGGSKKEEATQKYSYSQFMCENDDAIYISSNFMTGRIFYQVSGVESTKLSPYSFGILYSEHFSGLWSNAWREESEVTSYQCEEKLLQLGDKHWKAALCARRYKNYPDFYDSFIIMAKLGGQKDGNVVQVSLEGFSKEGSMAFIKKMLEQIK